MFSAEMYSVSEDQGPVSPELVLSRALSSEVTVEVYSMDGTATGKYCSILDNILM